MARRSGLGKGLGALIPSTDGAGDAELRELPVGLIAANTYQPRTDFDDEAIAELAASIGELGVLQPVLVRPAGDHFELVAGERRWRAAQVAGLTTIPAIVRAVDDHASLAQALVENLQREDLSAIEEAVAYQQLVDEFGLTPEQVGDRVSKSRSAVTNTMRLLNLPGDLQAMVRAGELSAGHGRALLAVEDLDQQRQLARRVVDEDLSVRAVEDAVRRLPVLVSDPISRSGTDLAISMARRTPRNVLAATTCTAGSTTTRMPRARDWVPRRSRPAAALRHREPSKACHEASPPWWMWARSPSRSKIMRSSAGASTATSA